MPDKKLTEVDASTTLADNDKLFGNISNAVKQITLTDLVTIIKNKIGSLKNPNKLKFTGAVTNEYDGSKEVTINIPTSSGGGSGTTNYTNLTNKPQINGVELSGNKTLDDLNIQPKGNYLTEVPSEYVTETELNNKGYATTTQLGNKLDKNQSASNSGKYLSVGSDGNITLVDAPTGGGTEGDVIDVDAEMKDYMQTVKPAIKSAIINKGGTVQDTDSFGDYATRISQIPNDISPAQTLPEQTTLVAESNSTGITLKWTDVDADGYLIVEGVDKQDCWELKTLFQKGQAFHDEIPISQIDYGNIKKAGFREIEMQEIIQYEYYETKEDLLALLLKTPILDDFSEIENANNTHNPSIEKDLFDTYVSTHTTSKGIELKRILYGIVAKK